MYSDLPLGEKIMYVRKAKGLSLDNVAYAIKHDKSYVSRLERGELKISDENLVKIKKFLEITNAPLLEHELKIFRERLLTLNDMLAAGRTSEVQTLWDDMAIILTLPYEKELCVLYKITGARLQLKKIAIPMSSAEQLAGPIALLDEVEGEIDQASDAARFLYHRFRGTVYTFVGNAREAIKHFMTALEHNNHEVKPCAAMYVLIGEAYNTLGKPYDTIKYIEQAEREYKTDRASIVQMGIPMNLASAYMQIKNYKKAKPLLEESINQSNILELKPLHGCAHINMAFLYYKLGDNKKAQDHCNQALECLEDVPYYYAIALATKGLSLIKTKDYAACEKIIEKGLSMTSGIQSLKMSFESLKHLMNLNNMESTNYLEDTALPFFKKGSGSDKQFALALCNELEAHYKKKRVKTKALGISHIMREIYEDMFMEDE